MDIQAQKVNYIGFTWRNGRMKAADLKVFTHDAQ
jgi:hypothetical protein